MTKNQYSDEFKEQIIKECQETGNVALVARRHEIATTTIHTWLKKHRQRGLVKLLPKAKEDRYKAIEKQLKEVSTENDRPKRLLTEKELQLAILKDLMNPIIVINSVV